MSNLITNQINRNCNENIPFVLRKLRKYWYEHRQIGPRICRQWEYELALVAGPFSNVPSELIK